MSSLEVRQCSSPSALLTSSVVWCGINSLVLTPVYNLLFLLFGEILLFVELSLGLNAEP